MNTYERTIVLPTHDNDGVKLSAVHSELRQRLIEIAGGYSQHKQLGAWRNDAGRVIAEPSIVYTVLCDASTDVRIAAMLPDICVRARQEALLTYSRVVDAVFIESGLAS